MNETHTLLLWQQIRQQAASGGLSLLQARCALFIFRASQHMKALADGMPQEHRDALLFGTHQVLKALEDPATLAAVERIAKGDA